MSSIKCSFMRYGIFADVHSNLEALEALIKASKDESIDKYLCVGDVVGYAANPRECVEQIKLLCAVTVAGNHDWASIDLFSTEYFNPDARKAVFWTKDNLNPAERYFLESLELIYKNNDLTLVHGSLDNPQDFNYLSDKDALEKNFRLLETKVCFVGHTHVAGIFIKASADVELHHLNDYVKIKDEYKYIVNVGSVGQPRDGNPNSAYCVYDTATKEIWIKRVTYEVKTAQKKIIAAGLPPFLAARLTLGR